MGAGQALAHRRRILTSALTLTLLTLTTLLPLASTEADTCKNTVQGRHYLADTKGQLCRRSSADWTSGCCRFAELEACTGCEPKSGCCDEFESCVACCLQPAHNAVAAMAVSPRGNNKPETGYFTDPFDYCRAKCRTNSKSTLHENAYKSPQHHCFLSATQPNEQAQSTTAGSKQVALPQYKKNVPTNFNRVAGNQGESCTQACARERRTCVPALLAQLNSCEVLRKHFPCEGGCQDSFGVDQPAYVVNTVLRMHSPGVCMRNSKPEIMTCDGAHANTKRICACSTAVQASTVHTSL